MATNCIINGNHYYRIYRKVGKEFKNGQWLDKRKAFYGNSKKEAEDKYQEYMQRKETCTEDRKCLGELMDIFITEVFKKSNLANSTKRKYISAYQRLLQNHEIAGWRLHDITALHLQEFYNSITECYSTRRALHNLLRRFYKYAELNGMTKDITGCLEIYKSQPSQSLIDVTIWPDEDVKKVINALEGTTLRLLIVLAVNTGLRFAELLALEYSDIKGNVLYVTKQLSEEAPLDSDSATTLHITETKTANGNRAIPLSASVMAEIERHKAIQRAQMAKQGYITNYLFTTSNGTFYYKRNVNRSLTRLYKRIGVKHRKFHAYRATFATNLARAGVPIEQTAKLLGHGDISVTARYYVHVSAEKQATAVEKIASFTLLKQKN